MRVLFLAVNTEEEPYPVYPLGLSVMAAAAAAAGAAAVAVAGMRIKRQRRWTARPRRKGMHLRR